MEEKKSLFNLINQSGTMSERDVWVDLRVKIKNSYEFSDDWNTAINLFSNRLDVKFFNPVEIIIRQKNPKGQGFSAVVVLCSLIEMFAAFRVGKIFNFKWNKRSPKYEYGGSRELFVKFLCQDKIFENIFWYQDKSTPPFSGEDFYSDVRCGLMHEARSKNNWHISTARKKVKTEN